jgi:hypothetical protein
MIYEFRTYTFHPGKLPEYLDLVKDFGLPLRGDGYGRCHGYWTAEFGALNQAWHLWSYADLNERTALRSQLQQNSAWIKDFATKVVPLVQRQDIRLMNPTIALKPPSETSGLFELRIYRTRVGAAGAWSGLMTEYLPAREKYSPIVGLWQTEAPQPNEVVHLWAYRDFDARTHARAAAAKDPVWREYLAKATQLIVEMQSTALLPTEFAPMR